MGQPGFEAIDQALNGGGLVTGGTVLRLDTKWFAHGSQMGLTFPGFKAHASRSRRIECQGGIMPVVRQCLRGNGTAMPMAAGHR
ncbi:hypothetical protein GCM10027040_28910 [Halomonas shantousis]